ncbi:MAG: putative transport system ATP-binding protein [Chloroflexota bacterium]|jgi:putative ABC transport system ATP-binding protein|nr:putative transport system ATP-binding protein [Chloroflexota bacterium]
MDAVLSCSGVTRAYRRPGMEPVVAVRDVHLRVEAGEFLAIQGPSGSGKTTLLGLMAGLELADEGDVWMLGHDASRMSSTERARLRRSRMGLVFQSFGLVASLTAIDNVALPLTLSDVEPADRRSRAANAMAEVGLDGMEDARIDEMSGGQRQRLGVARALVGEPVLILGDEPTGSLDDESAQTVLALLERTARARHASLVLVTHDPVSAARADRRLWMRDGRVAEKPI